uniref:Protein aurora borealis n=1 Tax=Panagrellus redivivus TaxID=6233 RepID=A0A7E4ULV7_PANRE
MVRSCLEDPSIHMEAGFQPFLGRMPEKDFPLGRRTRLTEKSQTWNPTRADRRKCNILKDIYPSIKHNGHSFTSRFDERMRPTRLHDPGTTN